MSATIEELDSDRSAALANQIGVLLTCYEPPEIARSYVGALHNANVSEPDPMRKKVLASRIATIMARYSLR